MGFSNLLVYIFTSAFLVQTVVLAQNCWKNTTCTGPADTAFPGIWESNIYAPSSRTVSPKSILSIETREIISAYPGDEASTLSGNGSQLVFDFGIEVGGLVSIKYSTTGGAGALGLAFSEAKNWIGEWSDSSNGAFRGGADGAIYGSFSSDGAANHTYVMPERLLRGGFRYLTLFLITNDNTTSLEIQDISLEIGFAPTWANLRAYQGYFHCSDEMLNQIWYGGAYTLQTNAVPVHTGRQVPTLTNGWANNGTMGPGDTIIVDGAKRDRAVWPGDMGIAVPSVFVSVGELDSVKNALQTMYNYQNSTTGAFPEAGPPLLQLGSDTYHMWTMIGTYNYVLYSNDTAFLLQNWSKYLKAMNFIYGKVGSNGLLEVTGIRDWARWQQGFNNSEANMILYHTLNTGASLATWTGENNAAVLNTTWLSQAESLKSSINKYCFSASYGSFKDNATSTTLYPQDANSMALLYGVIPSNISNSTTTVTTAQKISSSLMKNWIDIGAVAPELPGNISPFISSFEIQGHLTIGETDRALDLIRRSWGWYLKNENGTGSTVIEGYLANGTFGYRSSRGYGYDASYVSHAHGWSAGPTSALTNYILGLSITSPAGQNWKLAPQFGDLTSAEGGFMTSLGKYRAAWSVQNSSASSMPDGYVLDFETPLATVGELVLPRPGGGSANGNDTSSPSFIVVLDGEEREAQPGKDGLGRELWSLSIEGGKHSLVVS
ncbi:bacterial alpha-l-rhamnosidase domain-containing protein [Phlyctema vagabunda]|uniref:Bacterial alpha-l-rhamnosidase domain-containing protein n=1 Tax=Phlyctema vagabunda TaxID=108571 RepID=A0ABR4PF76_9HELO